MGTTIRETLNQGSVSLVGKKEEIALVKATFPLEPTTQNSRSTTSTNHVKKRMTSPWWSPLKRGTPCQMPFLDDILKEELPSHFHPPCVDEYKGTTDSGEYLGHFENSALLHQYSNLVKYRVFLTTLVRHAQQWFNTLSSRSIQWFDDFAVLFLYQFLSFKQY